MITVDLRKYTFLLPTYIQLRNNYVSELMTIPITGESTIDWIEANKGLLYGVMEKDLLVGAFSISFERRYEFTVFVRTPGFGIGRFIVSELEGICRHHNIEKVWARVKTDNDRAGRFFDKYFTKTNLGWEKVFA